MGATWRSRESAGSMRGWPDGMSFLAVCEAKPRAAGAPHLHGEQQRQDVEEADNSARQDGGDEADGAGHRSTLGDSAA